MSNRKYNVMITIDDETDKIVKKAGNGNRSQGIRTLAQQYAESNKEADSDIRNEMGEYGEILPVPGLDEKFWGKEIPEVKPKVKPNDDDQFAEWDC